MARVKTTRRDELLEGGGVCLVGGGLGPGAAEAQDSANLGAKSSGE